MLLPLHHVLEKHPAVVGRLAPQKLQDGRVNPQAVGGPRQWEVLNSSLRCRQLHTT